jgi:NADPH-dependent curcumin reductase CurA
MLDRAKVSEFRGDFAHAVANLEKQYGMNITLGTISFSGNELRGKMTATVGEKVIKSTIKDFQVGDVVFINHKTVDPIKTFEIIKINAKNVKVRDRDNNTTLSVSPGLLKK